MDVHFLSILPFVSGALVVWLLVKLDGSKFQVRGVVGPYFGSVAILFALFASLSAGEVWQRIAKVNQAIAIQADALDGIQKLSFGMTNGEAVRTALTGYIQAERQGLEVYASSGDTVAPAIGVPAHLHLMFEIGLEAQGWENNSVLQNHFIDELQRLRKGRLDQVELQSQKLSGVKILALLVFGFLTQTAIGLCHAGNARTSLVTVMLFSTAFAFAVYFVAMFNDPADFGAMISERDLALILE